MWAFRLASMALILGAVSCAARAPLAVPAPGQSTSTAKTEPPELHEPLARADRRFPEPPATRMASPPAFAGQEMVTVDQLVAALAGAVETIRDAPAVRREYLALLAGRQLAEGALEYDEYLAVRVVFEATRDGGLWGIVWDITNREGHSDAIWEQWQTATVPAAGEWGVTAVAECDELSALFAFLVRRLGVRRAGFLGGGPMHIVAHWTGRLPGRRELRIVVPTSQVFLSREATLGTQEINAYSAATVWDYLRQDVPPTFTIPARLARYFAQQLALVALPEAELQRLRNLRGHS